MRDIKVAADIFRIERPELANSTAFLLDGEATSYGELERESNRVANALIAAGIAPGDRVAILDKNSAAFAAILGGALKARAVLVPLNFRLSADEIDYIVGDAGCKLLFVGNEFAAIGDELAQRQPALRRIYMQQPQHGLPALAEWIASAADSDPQLAHEADDHTIQLYTSGTTGRPKGVCQSNARFLAGTRTLLHSIEFLKPEDVQLVCMPLCHIAGIANLLGGLLTGCRVVITRDFDPVAVLDSIQRYRVNTSMWAPAIIQFLLAMPGVEDMDFSSLQRIFYGSAPISPALLEQAQRVFGCEFCQLYGMTENAGIATFLPPEDHDPARGKLASCGKPYPGSELKIVNESGQPCAPGEVGEILTRSPWTMDGYWHRPEATEETLIDGWLHTGDAGYLDEDGYLFIHDRIKDMIVSGGENVYPAEVENALTAHPAVAEAAVFGVPDDRWGEAVKAAVVLHSEASEAELIAHVRERIAGFKTPKSIDFIDALPRNTAGKILRRSLRAPYWEGRERAVN